MGILLTGRRISAAQALEYGLVNEVVPDEALDGAVDAWVRDVVACAPLSLKAIKRSVQDTAHLTVREARNTRLPSLGRGASEPGRGGRRARVQGEAGAGVDRPLRG